MFVFTSEAETCYVLENHCFDAERQVGSKTLFLIWKISIWSGLCVGSLLILLLKMTFIISPHECVDYISEAATGVVIKNFEKFTEKHLCQGLLSNKIAGLRPAILLKSRIWHKCFLWFLQNFKSQPFHRTHPGDFLWFFKS